MDSVNSPKVRELIKRVLTEYAEYKPGRDAEAELIFDDAKGHYERMMMGWNGYRRIHGCVLHVDIKGDKIWSQHDGSRDGIALDLMDAGIRPTRSCWASATRPSANMTFSPKVKGSFTSWREATESAQQKQIEQQMVSK